MSMMGRKGFPGNSYFDTQLHKNIEEITIQADIIITALGVPNYLKANMVKDGVVVIDVGITRVPDETKRKRICDYRDVDFENVSKKSKFYYPVP
jgi:methylenetetrahydrofolate dehydrogenase (NADP+)/methenyltetrahydrofolate cyclohydrolase